MTAKIRRTIHYYEVHTEFDPSFILTKRHDTNLQALLSAIKKCVAAKESIRYQPIGDRMLFINEITIDPKPHKTIIKGKVLSVRKDFFPELIDTSTDLTRDISAAQDEGIVETTHFIIQEKAHNRTNTLKLAMEFNLYGAKISDLVYYMQQLGEAKGIVKSMTAVPIVKKSLGKVQKRIGLISKILVRLRKDNLIVLNDVDTGIYSAFKAATEEFQQDYVTVELKYDIRSARVFPNSKTAVNARSIVDKFIKSLLKNKKDIDKYNKLEVVAEDSMRNNHLNVFDLLVDKVKDDFFVERKDKSRTILSQDMFDKMIASWDNNHIV